MEKYEQLKVVGEGAYGKVIMCRHKETNQIVAIKKFFETDDDRLTRKVALREIRVLRKLRHGNLVNLLDVFRRKRRFYLVFEYISHSLLDELTTHKELPPEKVRKFAFQIITALDYCHANCVVHRDVKPENVLVSSLGVIKLCDFGFARFVEVSSEPFTDYVATRWYRAPELLLTEQGYGKPVDIWAIGCLVTEMLTNAPLFPGDSDMDQLYKILLLLGNLTDHEIMKLEMCLQQESWQVLLEGSNNKAISYSERDDNPILKKFPKFNRLVADLIYRCLRLDPLRRMTTSQLLQHDYFHHDGFADKFPVELEKLLKQEKNTNPLMQRHVPEAVPIKDGSTGRCSKLNLSPGKWKTDREAFCPLINPECSIYSIPPTSSDHSYWLQDPLFKHTERYDDGKRLNRDKVFNVEYKKDMFPQTQYVRVDKGRLLMDRDKPTGHCNLPAKKYVCEDDLTLPNIQGLLKAIMKKKDDSNILIIDHDEKKNKHKPDKERHVSVYRRDFRK